MSILVGAERLHDVGDPVNHFGSSPDFLGAGDKPRVLSGPDDNRRDQVARASHEIVQAAEDCVGRQVQADFLVNLPQRRAQVLRRPRNS